MRYLTKTEVLAIPADHLPLVCLSDNVTSWVAARIKALQNGFWNHYMWYYRPAHMATQDATFKVVPVYEYLLRHRLKLWWNPNWTAQDRAILRGEIKKGLDEPWYNRCYDPLQIIGIRFGMRWLQIPGHYRICSDHAVYLKKIDPRYDLVHPSPPDIDRWLKETDGYEVYGRYSPDY